jgi:hypothetical protein
MPSQGASRVGDLPASCFRIPHAGRLFPRTASGGFLLRLIM